MRYWTKIIRTEDSIALFILRCILCIVIFPHGAQKLLGWFGGGGYQLTTQRWLEWWGIPFWLTTLVILCEFFGMISLLIGFATRFIAACYIIIMCGAIYFTHWKWGFFMNWYMQSGRGEGFEFHLLVIGIAVSLLMNGSGRWSIDKHLANRIVKSNQS
ncbi:MAG: DoxX family protein [Flammeovirgaceae bacterium]|nr:DoxX family protein [Flammeovirgaceae bacterium]